MLETPEHRKNFAEDVLKQKGLYVPKKIEPLSEAQQIQKRAENLFDSIRTNVAKPLLRGLTAPSEYNIEGTQALLFSSFRTSFSMWGKDALITLVTMIHTEYLEKQCREAASAGVCGPDMDKPI